MKNKFIPLLISTTILFASFTYGAVQSASCSNFSSSGGGACGTCFEETTKLYTCNPYTTGCSRQSVTSMFDIASNNGSGNLVMYDGHEGSIFFYPLQSSFVSWSKSAPQVLDMFQFPAAYVSGRQNFSV
jgi:hypothetical protein